MDAYGQIATELDIDLDDPEEQLARDLAQEDDRLLEQLVAYRRALGVTQQDVANALGRHKSAVSNFERLGADPHQSTIRRYAAAIGVRIRHVVEPVRGLRHSRQSGVFIDHHAIEAANGGGSRSTVHNPRRNDPGFERVGPLTVKIRELAA